MSDELINNIKRKTNQLIEQNNNNKLEIEKLQKEIFELNHNFSEQKREISELHLKYKQLIIGEAILSNSDIDDAKKLMSRMVRDINKCIALLNV
ncbi:MAG: hypothetical protein NTW49_00055 [Bacteroidia bacterium]|nr:hypothetical protein [Bacteroidia bacterium]